MRISAVSFSIVLVTPSILEYTVPDILMKPKGSV